MVKEEIKQALNSIYGTEANHNEEIEMTLKINAKVWKWILETWGIDIK